MTIKAGIIGLGVGEQHISGYNKHPDCEVVVLCDSVKQKRIDLQKKYPEITIIANPNEILYDPNIDVISIASYDNFHHEQIIKALDNGKHVFVEKPLCLYESEAKEIRKKLNQTRLKLSSNLILRQSPRFQYVKELIEKNELGSIYYLESDYEYGRIYKLTNGWRGDIDFYSIVYGGGVHMIDLLLWLTNDTVQEVTSFGNNICTRNTSFKYNDMVVSILYFQSGIIAKVACNFGCVKPHFHALSVFGTNATFINDYSFGKLYKNRNIEEPPKKIMKSYPGINKGDLIYNFVESIIKDKRSDVSENEVFNTMSVCFAIEKSVQTRTKIKVNYL